MKKILIAALLETSDHDGYCSGGDCEYESRKIVHLCDIPEKYADSEIGVIRKSKSDNWDQYLPEPELNFSGSYYCHLSDKCKEARLGPHAYKYTILKVEIVDVI